MIARKARDLAFIAGALIAAFPLAAGAQPKGETSLWQAIAGVID